MLFNFAMKRIKSPVTDWMHQIEKAENIFDRKSFYSSYYKSRKSYLIISFKTERAEKRLWKDQNLRNKSL